MHYLYAITFTDGKKYIGISSRPMRRFKEHCRASRIGSRLPVHLAFKRNGESGTNLEIIGSSATRDGISWMEIEAIKQHRTLYPMGYNLHTGGDNSPAASPIVKAKISASLKARWAKPGMREAWSAAFKASGRTMSAENKAKLSERRKGKLVLTPEQQAAHSTKGIPRSAEVRARMSGRTMSQSAKMKTTATWMAKRDSPMYAEFCKAHSERCLARVQPEEEKARRAEAQAGKKVSPETREKLRIAHLGRIPTPESIEKKKATMASPECKEKMRNRRRQVMTDELREKRSKARLGVKLSDETRARIKAAWVIRKQPNSATIPK